MTARRTMYGLAMAALLVLALVSTVLAQSGGDTLTTLSAGYDLTWWTVDGGGWTFITGGAYNLGSTSGQPDAGLLAGGDFTLGGGFWGGGAPAGEVYRVYLPLIMR